MAQLIWLITGCSSGFGEQLVRSILARGDKVIATGRNLGKITHLQREGTCEVLELDVTSDQLTISNAIAKAIEVWGRVDVLVNNAAYIQVGTWEDLTDEDFRAQFETNLFGVIKVTKALLPHLRQNKAGTNVFISSLSGWIGHDLCGPYAASKFALEGAVESLWRETSPFGIKTLLIEPGRFRTKLLSNTNRKTKASSIPDYEDLSQAKSAGLSGEDQRQPGDPVKLAEIILDLARGEGVAEGRDVPFRLPLGIDCYDDIKAKCEETLNVLNGWEAVIRSTDYVE